MYTQIYLIDLLYAFILQNISSPDQVKIKLEFIMILKSLGTDVSPKVFKVNKLE